MRRKLSKADPISHLVVLILDNENHVETRQDGSLEVNILRGAFNVSCCSPTAPERTPHLSGRLHIIISSEDRVGSSQNTGPRV